MLESSSCRGCWEYILERKGFVISLRVLLVARSPKFVELPRDFWFKPYPFGAKI
jgi:hypothetical protein